MQNRDCLALRFLRSLAAIGFRFPVSTLLRRRNACLDQIQHPAGVLDLPLRRRPVRIIKIKVEMAGNHVGFRQAVAEGFDCDGQLTVAGYQCVAKSLQIVSLLPMALQKDACIGD